MLPPEESIFLGLIYTLFFDGDVVARAQNFFARGILKIPMRLRLEAQVSMDAVARHLVASVDQGLLFADYSLSVDGKPVPLELVK